MNAYRKDCYTVRKLMPREWQVLKALRLETAREEPNIFVLTYEDQLQRTDEEWGDILRETNRAYFILVHEDEVVGISGVARHSEDPHVGVLVASYIREAHRGKGLSNLFYQARLDWAVRKNLRRMIVSHRKDNKTSKAAIRKFMFDYTHEILAKWPDGTTEEQIFYQLDLQKWRDTF